MMLGGLLVSIGCNAANSFEDICLKGTALDLHDAIWKGDLAEVERLTLERGVESSDGVGATSLMVAAQQKQDTIAQYLLENGANAKAQSKARWTALHYATAQGASQDLVRMLLAHGADKTVINALGQTPEQCARERGNHEIADYIARYRRTKSASKG